MLSPADRQLFQLKNLQQLELAHNRLTEIPVEIAQLTQLKVLNLSHNLLRTLPVALKQLKNLQQLNLGGNPLNEVEREKIVKWLPHVNVFF